MSGLWSAMTRALEDDSSAEQDALASTRVRGLRLQVAEASLADFPSECERTAV